MTFQSTMLVGWLLVLALLFCPQVHAKSITDRDRTHWAFQPLKRIAPPILETQKSRIQNSIDQFILARLETNGLALAPAASKAQLIRRVTFGLIGLPP